MIKCNEECTPCCDFCIYAIHETFEYEELGGTIYGGPIHCQIHPDEEHDNICESYGSCDDFHCYRATIENSFIPGYDSSEEIETEIQNEIIDSNRTRAVRRHNDFKKAIRKRKLSMKWRWDGTMIEQYKYLHQYSKNKIHCSCPMCSNKTNNKHRRGSRGWEPTKNWSKKDMKQLENMKEQVEEEWSENSQD